MKGLDVKKILIQSNYTLRDVAYKLNITPQLLNNWLNVDDIKTGTLERIAQSIDKDIYYFIDRHYERINKKIDRDLNFLSEPEPPYNNAPNSCPECAKKQNIIEYLKDQVTKLESDKERLWRLIEGNDQRNRHLSG